MSARGKGGNIFSLFGSEAGRSGAEETEYYPFGISRDETQTERWFRVHYADGGIEMLPYSALRKVSCPSDERIELHVSDGVIALTGLHLSGLLALIQDAQLRSLYPLVRSRHASPPDGEPVITQISRHESGD